MKTICCEVSGSAYSLPYGTTEHVPKVGEYIRLVNQNTGEQVDIIKAIPFVGCKTCPFSSVNGCRNNSFRCPPDIQFQSMNDVLEGI